jgi:membrane protein DedA with SNARE-associated domain
MLKVDDISSFYPILYAFGLLVAAGFGLPIPEELPIIGAGIWVGSTPELGPYRWVALPVCILGVVLSDGVLYFIGLYYGTRLLEKRWVAKVVPPEKRSKIESNFLKYGVMALLFARLLPGLRTPIFITAGTMRLPYKRFLLADGIYAIPGVSLIFFLSYWFGQQFKELVDRAEHRVDQIKGLVILCVLVAVGVYLVMQFLRRPVSTGDPKELPLIGGVAAKIEEKREGSSPHVELAQQAPGTDGAPSPANDHAAGPLPSLPQSSASEK